MDPIQALAILSLGAFVAVLVTALFYVFTVRPRLLDPGEAAGLGVIDDRLGTRLTNQHAAVERLNVALTHHTSRLEAAVGLGQEFESLRRMLRAHSTAVQTLARVLQEVVSRLDGLGERLSRQEAALDRAAQQHVSRLDGFGERLSRQEAALDRTAQQVDALDAEEPQPRRPEEVAQVPGVLRQGLGGEAASGLEDSDPVALLGKAQRAD